MGPRYKVTGCARFFLFLILFVPAVFFGAAYIRGENGLHILRDFYHSIAGSSGTTSEKKQDSDTYDTEDLQRQLQKAQEEIRELKKRIEELEKQ